MNSEVELSWDKRCNRSNACHSGKMHRIQSNRVCVLYGLRESIRQDKLEKDDGNSQKHWS